ncbi:putative mannose-resistant/Proteus-like fimbrial protein [Yersinia aldovae]|uniref:fimbrial protein n=1 Tax=Yersinia aldovae TaxID=29483 RepID=UPI0005E92714|nr:fimbrial protein [Yersinia aldovae]CNI11569.1 putative mannose-resistant/Proteus-like fimbrial protein [Yersinia aldovae]
MSELFKRTLLVAVVGMICHTTQAADLSVTGHVVASPCNVDSGSVSKDIDFGQLRSTDLKTAGSTSDWQAFQIKLTNCPLSTNKATATFSGTPATENNTLYANTGTAENVAVQMAQDSDKAKVLGNGSSMTVDIDARHNAVYDLTGRLLSVAGNTGPGTFSSVVQMNFTYQ